ncbi:MAG TPA: FxSxx-COOH system tetratricopeptide repeat protein [Candidatus Angelobacter sp.]|nr:FxSxx-COOH system tetratricopeptide repeat protein [Candidatus Angelobacter sp.]
MLPERPPKVFISYSHDSAEHEKHVLDLANRLRRDGIDATIDQYETSPREGWPVWMEMQIRESDFVLVVCTATYLGRAERREKEGVGKGAIWETALTLQYLYEASANNERFIPAIFNHENVADIPMPLRSATYYLLNTEEGCQRLLRRLRKQPEVHKPDVGTTSILPISVPQGAAALLATGKSRRPWLVPHARNDAFTGREQLLIDLRADLVKKRKQALSGLGGVGKTQIAVEYAYRYKDEYTAVLWTFADTEQSVRGGFARIASLLNLPDKDATEQAKVTEAVRSWLEENSGWLLVLDNADDPAAVNDFLPQQGKGHILVTSRAHQFQNIGIFSPREIDVLSPDEAREFLLLRTGKTATAKSPEAAALAKELGYLPLALEQAAAYIVEKGASFASYLAGFKRQRQTLLNQQGPVLGNEAKEQQKRTVATTWSLNFADIEKNSQASADLLRLSAFLAPDAIPLELFEKGTEAMPEKLALELAEAADNPLVLDDLLSPLLRYSLVRRDDEKWTYSIHPLVQEVVREGLPDQKSWAERSLLLINSTLPDVTKFENWSALDRFLPHALNCAHFIESLKIELPEAALLLNQAANYLVDRAEYARAEPLYRRALVILEKTLGSDHPNTARNLNDLGVLYYEQKKYDEAEPMYRRALAIEEKMLGPEHPNTADSLNNLAVLNYEQGRYDEAEPLCLRVLTIREKTLGPEHPHTAQSLNNMAQIYRFQGRDKDSEPLHCRALEIREKKLGPMHPDTAESMNNLAGILNRKGNHSEAEPLYRRALAILESALGNEHPHTTHVRGNLIHFYRDQGRSVEADALGNSAKEKAQ